MRVGIFGGTFDPIHVGHLVLAEQCREQAQLDEIWFVPAAEPPHKLTKRISPAKSRCAMIEFAIAGNPSFRLNTIELDRSGPSFTVTTLEQLHAFLGVKDVILETLSASQASRVIEAWK